MNHTQFFQAIKQGAYPLVCLMEGPEEYIKQSALQRLEKALLPEGLEALNESLLENPETDAKGNPAKRGTKKEWKLRPAQYAAVGVLAGMATAFTPLRDLLLRWRG